MKFLSAFIFTTIVVAFLYIAWEFFRTWSAIFVIIFIIIFIIIKKF